MADYASAKHEKGLPKGNPFLLWNIAISHRFTS